MPAARCKHPTCTAIIARPATHCPDHAGDRRAHRAAQDRYYSQHIRDPEAQAFYHSRRWKLARAAKLAESPICSQCRREWARHVHHRKPLAQCTDTERTDPRVLMAVCPDCHNTLEAELRAAGSGAA